MSDFFDDYDDEEIDEAIEKYNSRKKPTELNIPEFLTKRTDTMDLPTEEQLMAQALLNNVPNSTEIETLNHLNELEQVCQNWSEEEWRRVLYYTPSKLMTDEVQRRMSAAEEYRKAMVDADEVMKRLKL